MSEVHIVGQLAAPNGRFLGDDAVIGGEREDDRQRRANELLVDRPHATIGRHWAELVRSSHALGTGDAETGGAQQAVRR
jgi:hypothetical protein